jgi:hypothetical protein
MGRLGGDINIKILFLLKMRIPDLHQIEKNRNYYQK